MPAGVESCMLCSIVRIVSSGWCRYKQYMEAVHGSSTCRQYMEAVNAAYGLMYRLICLVPENQLLAAGGCLL